MDTSLAKLGLTELQQQSYIKLLDSGRLTTAQLADKLSVKRTTVHMALGKLQEIGLIEHVADETSKGWQAVNPVALKKLLNQQKAILQQTSNSIEAILPSMVSRYRLSHQQPGVLHIEGQAGIKTLYDDIIRSSTNKEVLIFPSKHDRDNDKIATYIDGQILRQQLAGIRVRALYNGEKLSKEIIDQLAKKNIQVRFFGQDGYDAQTIIYGDNVAISTFKETMYTTIITSKEIAASYRTLFENMWSLASL